MGAGGVGIGGETIPLGLAPFGPSGLFPRFAGAEGAPLAEEEGAPAGRYRWA
jgi:hypothetical protein